MNDTIVPDRASDDDQLALEHERYKTVIRRKLAQAYADAFADPDVVSYLRNYGKDYATVLIGSFRNIINAVCAPPTQHYVQLTDQNVELLLAVPDSPEWRHARDFFAPKDEISRRRKPNKNRPGD